jgi:hypothetical protein
VRIFVGGTGRSGTTQIAEIIGQHPLVWYVPQETRFLVDPGGLNDLVESLSTRYTPFHGWDALTRFESLLGRGGRHSTTTFPHADLPGIFGAERYARWVERFLAELTWYEFDDRSTRRVVGRYFADRSELVRLCRSYVDELFTAGAQAHEKPYWCEKTPTNVLATDFLWELFPEAVIVQIVRHPVQVAASHLSMDWAPDDIASVCAWLEPLYRRWLASNAVTDPRCVQVRLEDLADDWPAQRQRLFARLGLPDAATELTMSTERVAHWAPLSAADEAYVRDRLGFALDSFGYD